jgi:putative phosphoribosyl transferase
MNVPKPHLTDRKEAGLLLAARLQQFKDHPRTLVLALPRGGIEVGYMISSELKLPLEVFLVRKLGYPGNPEFAMGAITETGFKWINPDAPEMERQGDPRVRQFLEEEIVHQQQEIHRQQMLYRQGNPLRPLDGYTVVLVDDGIATGSTFLAAIHSLRQLGIHRLIAGIPLGPVETIHQIEKLVDHLQVLRIPDPFVAVGLHYQHFPQVEDHQVLQLLATARRLFPDPIQPDFFHP